MKQFLLFALALLPLAACHDATSPMDAPMAVSPSAPYSVTNGPATMNDSGDMQRLESGAGPAGIAPNAGSLGGSGGGFR